MEKLQDRGDLHGLRDFETPMKKQEPFLHPWATERVIVASD